MSICAEIISPSTSSKGFILKGAAFSFPRVKIFGFKSECNKTLYSVFAGSITRKGTFASLNNFRHVVVFPLPVTPAIKMCFLRLSLEIKNGIFNSRPL